ncbi:hypothetical protein BaRGS_00022442 [Batillaria attramentaria]|uniref:Uncharacterized protein n=1 Tax=Batillaria attramentaria TaxID=370345 RepID=A0ABD0KGX1_9CAEN
MHIPVRCWQTLSWNTDSPWPRLSCLPPAAAYKVSDSEFAQFGGVERPTKPLFGTRGRRKDNYVRRHFRAKQGHPRTCIHRQFGRTGKSRRSGTCIIRHLEHYRCAGLW